MAESAALLADEVLPECPLRQWVLSLPHAPGFLLAGLLQHTPQIGEKARPRYQFEVETPA